MESGKRKVILLNASNMESYPVYPYAFIQVPAVARLYGVEVICQDLLGFHQDEWGKLLQNLISDHDPAMILITLRNTDSMVAADYDPESHNKSSRKAYFPIERTRELITTIREISAKKIVVGGFAFSLLADDLMDYLKPDFGVFGGPDGFFRYFDDIQMGEYHQIPNLLYFLDGDLVSNQRNFYPPYKAPEYTSSKIKEMIAFYESFPDPGFQGAPVEVMRGCCHRCVFCAEPHVEGRGVQYRDLAAVMADIKILTENGINKLYMISSELNPEGNDFLLTLADHIKTFNFYQPDGAKVTWFGSNYLLTLKASEFNQLYESGFTGGWFDVTALDDENARLMRTPYKNSHLVKDLKTYLHVKTAWSAERVKGADSTNQGEHAASDNPEISWTMFLSNPATTIATVRKTLKIASQESFAKNFSSCSIIKNIRVFDYQVLADDAMNLAYSVSPALKHVDYDQLLPSFGFPPALLEHFGHESALQEFFEHIAETYLSLKYIKSRDWQEFIQANTTLPLIKYWLTELADLKGGQSACSNGTINLQEHLADLETIFTESTAIVEEHVNQQFSTKLLEGILAVCMECFPEVLRSLSLPDSNESVTHLSAYEMARIVYSRWSKPEQLVHDIKQNCQHLQSSNLCEFIRFCVLALLYRFNVKLRPEYKIFFI